MRTLWVLWVVAIGCGGNSANKTGELGGQCYPNATCNVTLACVNGKCVADVLDAGQPDAPIDARSVLVDAPPDSSTSGVCNVLTQTGCSASEKCTWIIDQANMTSSVGHIGCAPNGVQVIGAACTRNPPGATGYDNCQRGSYCYGPDTGGAGICKQICDQAGGSPACAANYACVTYDGLFGPSGMTVAAGVCEPECDPLADNNFLGSNGNNRTGSTCGSAGSASGAGFLYSFGCYGFPYPPNGPTRYNCTRQYNYSRVHRAACDTTQHTGDLATCAPDSMHVYINGCASGYMPLFVDAEGSTQTDCMAFCKPASCYNTGSGLNAGSSTCGLQIRGTAPYDCSTPRLQFQTFNQIDPTSTWSAADPTTNNGEQCYYSWLFEIDSASNMLTGASPTSDTVGWCVDHTKYKYDPTGGSNNTTTWPRCDGIGIGSNGYGVGAAGLDAVGFGCVDSATARAHGEVMFNGKATFVRPLLREPYHATARR